jgi:hypothetical protein
VLFLFNHHYYFASSSSSSSLMKENKTGAMAKQTLFVFCFIIHRPKFTFFIDREIFVRSFFAVSTIISTISFVSSTSTYSFWCLYPLCRWRNIRLIGVCFVVVEWCFLCFFLRMNGRRKEKERKTPLRQLLSHRS